MTAIVVRDERPGDEAAISALTTAAFADAPHASGTEAAIVEGLREAGDLFLSLVAERDGRVVGHVAFSPVMVAGEAGWFGLGPISVEPSSQRQGTGGALVREGLDRLGASGARGCVLIGDPAYYERFGFRPGGVTYRDVPPAYVQGLAFGRMPRGEIAYAPAFDSQS